MIHLKVAVRVRPLSRREIDAKSSSNLTIENGKTISVTNTKVPEQNVGDSRERIRRFTFDFCFDQNATQENVFEAVENVVGRALKRRCHSCVLAYGQSSSGKTHTMMGFPHDPGLTPRLCRKIFGYLQETAVGNEIETSNASVSFLEIYNEKVRDLLCHDDRKIALKVRHHPKKGPYVQGLSEHYVDNAEDLLNLLQIGDSARKVSSTLTNPQSSRSHSVFIVNCAGVKLTLVDLAGSERAGNTKSYSSCTFREGANINKSLVALGNVISALAEQTPSRRRFVPFRDSILTWLLRDTLGGSSDTVMIATVSPSDACHTETVNTLRFGQRAKLIVTAPAVNEDPREKTIRELRTEIARLKELIIRLPHPHHPSAGMEQAEAKSNQGQPKAPSSPNDDSSGINASERKTLEKLIPVMSVISTNDKPRLLQTKLRRTFSVEHSLVKSPAKTFGSEETIRRPSITKKQEKGTGTDSKLFVNVSPKVDSIRKVPIKSKSQIVAAVTHRLYAKTKKKEVATDTSDFPPIIPDPPKELQICSNARSKLKELTRKALKAHRNRNVETQTDPFPVLRVKEICTDVADLKIDLNQVRNIETCTESVSTLDKSVECCFLEGFCNSDKFKGKFLVTTRSCGTQFSSPIDNNYPSTNNLSFTKYLLESPKVPIFTNTLNINIANTNNNGSADSSDDSLDLNRDNLCFPTPDLISNHNSLEPNHAIIAQNERIPQVSSATESETEVIFEISDEFLTDSKDETALTKVTVPFWAEQVAKVSIPIVCAPQLCVNNLNPERCQIFIDHSFLRGRKFAKGHFLIESKTCYFDDDCVRITEPLVLKSIMKHFPETELSQSSQEDQQEIPDSLEYHLANNSKRVRFISKAQNNHNKPRNNDKILKVMSGFLEEATILMSNLSTTVTKIHSLGNFEDFDLQITVNDISGLMGNDNFTQTKKLIKDANSQTDFSLTNKDRGTRSSMTTIPPTKTFNKYEILLEDSCKRLEEKLNKNLNNNPTNNTNLSLTSSNDDEDYSYNPWDLSTSNINQDYYNHDDGSLESNPVTFSDYGSLPRRSKNRNHHYSPSAYLRQLTSMRRQVVDYSREDLFNNSFATTNNDN